MAVTINASLSAGLVQTADTTGDLNLQSGGTTIVAVTSTGAAVTGTLSASGASTFAAGTAGAPAITTTGDTNTGIFFPAADTIAFAEGGVESMRIDSSGNLSNSGTGYVGAIGVTNFTGATQNIYGSGNGTTVTTFQTLHYNNTVGANTEWTWRGNATSVSLNYSTQSAPTTFTQAMTLASTGTLSLAGGAKFSTNVFEIGKTYAYGDFTGVQGVASNVAFLALIMGNDASGAGTSALYLVNPKVASGNNSTSATKIAGNATMSATFAYAATDIFRITFTGSDSGTGWKCVG